MNWRNVFGATDPVWSPDGRGIAFAVLYVLSDCGGADYHGRRVIMTMAVESTGAFYEVAGGGGSDPTAIAAVAPSWYPRQ